MGFFKRIKTAIFKFDEYEKFLVEKPSKAVIYYLKLMLIFAVIITTSIIYILNVNIKNFKTVLKSEAPEFTISENTLVVNEEENFEHYFEKANFNFVIDQNSNDMKLDYDNYLLLGRNQAIIGIMGQTRTIAYNEILNGNEFSSNLIIEFLEGNNLVLLNILFFLILFIYVFLIYLGIIIIDIFTMSILGLIINKIIKTKFKYRDLFKLSVYSMTLPIILYLVYNVLNILYGVSIKYFEIGYDAISYIYLITVMLMLRSDIIKNMQELKEVIDEQKKVHEELKQEKEREKKEKKENENKQEKDKKEPKEKDKKPGKPQTNNG